MTAFNRLVGVLVLVVTGALATACSGGSAASPIAPSSTTPPAAAPSVPPTSSTSLVYHGDGQKHHLIAPDGKEMPLTAELKNIVFQNGRIFQSEIEFCMDPIAPTGDPRTDWFNAYGEIATRASADGINLMTASIGGAVRLTNPYPDASNPTSCYKAGGNANYYPDFPGGVSYIVVFGGYGPDPIGVGEPPPYGGPAFGKYTFQVN